MKLAYLVRETKNIYYPNDISYNEFNSYNQHNIIVRYFDLFGKDLCIAADYHGSSPHQERVKKGQEPQPALSL